MKSKPYIQKNERLQLRLSTQQKAVIARAAKLKQTNLSNFILEKSIEVAQEIIAQQTRFSLSDQEWKTFCDVLDEPPKTIPTLRQLLTEPSVFDCGIISKRY